MLSERQTYLRRVHHRREAHQIIWKSGRASSLVQQNFRGPLNAAEYSGGMCSWRGRTQVIKIGCANQGNWSCSRYLVESNWGHAGDWFIYQKLTSHQLNIRFGGVGELREKNVLYLALLIFFRQEPLPCFAETGLKVSDFYFTRLKVRPL